MQDAQSPTRIVIHMSKRAAKVFLLSLFSLLSADVLNAQEKPLVFVHATVIDATGAPAQPDATVVITSNRITAIGKTTELPVPVNSNVIDATGQFLIPGLWDMHVHWDAKEYLPLFIANGITGVRIMWGKPEHHQWRKELAQGSLLSPRLLIASAIIDGPNPTWPGSDTASNAAEGRAAVLKAKQEGADFVKVYSGLPRDAYFAIVDQAKKLRLPFEGHVPASISPAEASAAGQKSIEHLDQLLPPCTVDDVFNPAKAEPLFAEFTANHTWQCPTLTVLHLSAADPSIVNDDRVKYMPPTLRAYWSSGNGRFTNQPPGKLAIAKKTFRTQLEIVGAMQRAGVGILAGTDTGNPYCFPGFSLHDELAWLVQAGLTPMQAIQAATRNPARFMDRENDLGTIEQGKLADLVLLDANPLDDITNTRRIAAVVYNGHFYPRQSLEEMLAYIFDLASKKTVSDLLFETFTQKGVDAAIQQYKDLKSAHAPGLDFSEDDLNTLGYELLVMKKNKDAIKILKLNAEIYPESSKVYIQPGHSLHGRRRQKTRPRKPSTFVKARPQQPRRPRKFEATAARTAEPLIALPVLILAWGAHAPARVAVGALADCILNHKDQMLLTCAKPPCASHKVCEYQVVTLLHKVAVSALPALVVTATLLASPDAPQSKPPTMAEVISNSTPADWRPLDPENTLYLELASGRVVIELAPAFAPNHVANVKALAREHYYDGLAIIRVQDNYVVQWADPNAEKPELKRKIQHAHATLSAEFERPLDPSLPFTPLPDKNVYAPEVGFSGDFPVARDPQTGKMWLVHCYGMVGAGRDNAPDSGGGTELYAVIGHAPRQLDRNVTLLGRVVQGMELLSALPRGPAPMGFYDKPAQNVPIKSIRVAADLPQSERTHLEIIRTDTQTFRDLIESRRNRHEPWFHYQANRLEIGNVPIPVRQSKAAASTQ